MIIPIKCFTCGKVLADKWEYFKNKSKDLERQIDDDSMTIEDINSNSKKKMSIYFDPTFKGKLLDDLGLKKICCRRHMLGHVDLIDII